MSERDYQKDLEICEKMNSGEWLLAEETYIHFARTVAPWYIRRVMELESQLQQAEEREKAMKEVCEAARDYYEHIGLLDLRLEVALTALDTAGEGAGE